LPEHATVLLRGHTGHLSIIEQPERTGTALRRLAERTAN
jgi:hypothetical protein